VQDRFDDETLRLLDATEEVRLETRSARGDEHRTTIWIVVDGTDVYIRAVRGPRGRWYRELLANPEAALRVGRRRIAVRAVPATDERSIEACNEALRRKYTGIPGFEPMFREHTLPTTLRLLPA
jgi:hypothetical protein